MKLRQNMSKWEEITRDISKSIWKLFNFNKQTK